MIVFIYIIIMLVCIILLLLLSSIEISIQEAVIESYSNIEKILQILLKEKNLKKKLQILKYIQFEIKFKFLLLEKFVIFSLKINNYKMKAIIEKQYDKEKRKSELEIEKDKKLAKNISKAILPKIMLKRTDFNMELGTDDAAFTAIVTSIINILISVALPYVSDVDKIQNINYEVRPIYLNKNVFFLQFSGIISLKLVHIMNVICKRRRRK